MFEEHKEVVQVRELEEKAAAIKEKLRNVTRDYKDGKKFEKLVGFLFMLKEKYPDYKDYLVFWKASGATPDVLCSKLDFPGDDSIEKFIGAL